jgi:hypothetical protein
MDDSITVQQHLTTITLGINKLENVCIVLLCYLMMLSVAKIICLYSINILVQLLLFLPYRHV